MRSICFLLQADHIGEFNGVHRADFLANSRVGTDVGVQHDSLLMDQTQRPRRTSEDTFAAACAYLVVDLGKPLGFAHPFTCTFTVFSVAVMVQGNGRINLDIDQEGMLPPSPRTSPPAPLHAMEKGEALFCRGAACSALLSQTSR